jgi:hypothetical protein
MGVSPPPPGLPNAITPEKVKTALSHCAGAGLEVTGTVPSFKACVFFILCYDKKNSTESK